MRLGVVDRCVCHNITFHELKQLADQTAATLPDLVRRTGCTTSCGLCRPYIEVVLATGRTELPVMTPEECKKLTGAQDTTSRTTPGTSPNHP